MCTSLTPLELALHNQRQQRCYLAYGATTFFVLAIRQHTLFWTFKNAFIRIRQHFLLLKGSKLKPFTNTTKEKQHIQESLLAAVSAHRKILKFPFCPNSGHYSFPIFYCNIRNFLNDIQFNWNEFIKSDQPIGVLFPSNRKIIMHFFVI